MTDCRLILIYSSVNEQSIKSTQNLKSLYYPPVNKILYPLSMFYCRLRERLFSAICKVLNNSGANNCIELYLPKNHQFFISASHLPD